MIFEHFDKKIMELPKILKKLKKEKKMNFEGMSGLFAPKISSKIISALIALCLVSGGVKGFEFINEKPSDKTDDGTVTDGTLQTEGDVTEEKKENFFSSDGAVTVSEEVSAGAVLVCDMNKLNIIAQKEKEKVINCGDASVFATALIVSRAIDSGKISETDYAVCPASAQKKPNYSLSSEVLSAGKKMMIKDILRCMIYQKGSSFAYTLAVHVSGSEESFVSEMNNLAGELKLTNTAFTNVCGSDDGVAKTTACDLAVLVRYFLNDERLKEMFSSSEKLTVQNSNNQSSVYLTVANDFFVTCCTESQAKVDGIEGGKTGFSGDEKWSVILFSKEGTEYLIITLGSNSPLSETLKLFTLYT